MTPGFSANIKFLNAWFLLYDLMDSMCCYLGTVCMFGSPSTMRLVF